MRLRLKTRLEKTVQKISIVVPFYNAERHIENCIKSLKNQTYPNLQIILVDDRSSDNTFNLLQQKTAGDARFTVVKSHPPHGVCCARNTGIELADGDYVTFFDCDDILSPYHVENLYNAIKSNDADIAICHYKKVSKNATYDKMRFNKADKIKYDVHDKISALKHLLTQTWFEFSVWNKLYSIKIFKQHGVRFLEGCRYNEDTLFNYNCFKVAEKAVFSWFSTYFYVKSAGSLVRTTFKEYRLDAYKSLHTIVKDVHENMHEILHYSHVVRGLMTCELLLAIKFSKFKNPPAIRKLIEIVSGDVKHFKHCKELPAVRRKLIPPLVPTLAKVLLCRRKKDKKGQEYFLPPFM